MKNHFIRGKLIADGFSNVILHTKLTLKKYHEITSTICSEIHDVLNTKTIQKRK